MCPAERETADHGGSTCRTTRQGFSYPIPLEMGCTNDVSDVVLHMMYRLYGHLCPSKARWWM